MAVCVQLSTGTVQHTLKILKIESLTNKASRTIAFVYSYCFFINVCLVVFLSRTFGVLEADTTYVFDDDTRDLSDNRFLFC